MLLKLTDVSRFLALIEHISTQVEVLQFLEDIFPLGFYLLALYLLGLYNLRDFIIDN
jgi:hypothetical protein